MKITLSLLFIILIKSSLLSAQTPTSCFVIEDILVDACLTPSNEGENEMLRLRIGPNDLNTADLTASWPNNSYNGICQDAQTASVVNQINNTITGCGFLKEPVNGVLPAGSQVLFFTSTEPEISYHDYSALNDTMIVIFQCGGNLAGHFANWGTGLRTTTITFSGPNGCTDVKTYDRALLTNQNGGIGGTAALRDGAGVRYNFITGDVIYYNEGCVVPVTPVEVEILSNDTTICPGENIFLEGYSFNATEVLWYGGDGTFTDSGDYTTTYISSANDNSPFYIYFQAVNACQILTDSILITPTSGPPLSLNINPGNTVCIGDTIQLSTNSNEPHQWFKDGTLISGETSNTISLTEEGSFFAQIDNAGCIQTTDTVVLNFENLLSAEINNTSPGMICLGDSLTLNTDAGFSEYRWFFNDNLITTTTDNFINISEEGSYSVLINPSSSCTDTSALFNVVVNSPMELAILSSDSFNICQNESATIIADPGFSNYQWFIDGAPISVNNNEVSVNQAGNYYTEAIDANGCQSTSTSVNVQVSDTTEIILTVLQGNPDFSFCPEDSLIVLLQGVWQNQEWTNQNNQVVSLTDSLVVNQSDVGEYTITAVNNSGCPSTFNLEVDVLPTTDIDILSENGNMLCSGETTVLSIGSNYQEIIWNNEITAETIEVDTYGTYEVSALDENTCMVSGSTFIDFAAEIWYNLEDTLTVYCKETYTIESFSSDAVSFSWSPSEIFTDNNLENPEINEVYSGQISVTMEDQNNCTKVAESHVKWTPCGDLFLPNAFAPDGLNNTFSVLGKIESIRIFNLKIFNRWGELVFETSEPNVGWDGMYKGQKAPIGSYVWFIDGRFEDGRILKINETVSGNVLLIR